ncbi:hypothetical protein [Candidatus Bathycorpusculum sp.]|jgi:uncharacterized protein YoxC|uniref:hypothetical protein n=1 Tax=Candidatus Bathycorpusculum sp. TaxID=2994959 RepID=UPI002821B4C2|nr:hypothetical protein [Candidatus Termitimicrobium sp.]MCL2431724.1 hypothetical protein [Candidatus Termitimicrobium sp.]
MTQEVQAKNSHSITVIALGLICIILAASTIAVVSLYKPDQTELDNKDKTIEELNNQITVLTDQISSLMLNQNDKNDQSAEIKSLNDRLAVLGSDLAAANTRNSDAQKIMNLEISDTIFNKTVTQEAGKATIIYEEKVPYAGYIKIESAKSNSTSTYVKISYTYKDLLFDYKVTLGDKDKTVLLPMLPCTIKVEIGNENKDVGEEETVYDNKVDVVATMYW